MSTLLETNCLQCYLSPRECLASLPLISDVTSQCGSKEHNILKEPKANAIGLNRMYLCTLKNSGGTAGRHVPLY